MHLDPVEQARRFAEQALSEMARLAIAPSPNHYLIWYSHCSGCYPELSQRLRSMEAQGEKFTELRLAELHERFFGTGRQARLLDETCHRIEATMNHLLAEVAHMARDTGSYGDRLETLSSALGPAQPIEGLRSLIGAILNETRRMLGRSRRIELALARSSQQIEGLRSDLADAQREAYTDGLTGLANRKCFDYELASAVEAARERNETLSLLLADIDHFKRFNDTHGHQVGDQVLRLVAQVFTKSVKGQDLAARYGGEEFVVLLPRTSRDGAAALAEQIRQTVAGNRLRLKANGQYLGSITLSIGCAEYHRDEPISDLVRRADDALYQAKREGRNRIVAAPPFEAVERVA
jgi:diguanylate cyclase